MSVFDLLEQLIPETTKVKGAKPARKRAHRATGKPRGRPSAAAQERREVRKLWLSKLRDEYEGLLSLDELTDEEQTRRDLLASALFAARPSQTVRHGGKCFDKEPMEILPQEVSASYAARLHPTRDLYDVAVVFCAGRLEAFSAGYAPLEERTIDGSNLRPPRVRRGGCAGNPAREFRQTSRISRFYAPSVDSGPLPRSEGEITPDPRPLPLLRFCSVQEVKGELVFFPDPLPNSAVGLTVEEGTARAVLDAVRAGRITKRRAVKILAPRKRSS